MELRSLLIHQFIQIIIWLSYLVCNQMLTSSRNAKNLVGKVVHLLIYPDIIYAASIVNQNENWLLKNRIYPDIIYAPLDQNCCFQEEEEEEEEMLIITSTNNYSFFVTVY